MRHPIRAALVLVPVLALAACSTGDDSGAGKEVADLQAELQRVQKENEKLAAQVAAQTRRVDGLTEDLNHVRQLTMEVRTASVAPAAVSATDGGAAPAATGGSAGGVVFTPAQAEAMKAWFATEEGRKAIDAAITAERDAQRDEQSKRQVNAMVDRFAKLAGLTEDQTKRMKEILGKQAETIRESFAAVRDVGPEGTPEQRTEARQQAMAKADEIRKQTDEQVKTVLASSQYDLYQQEQDKMRANMRGIGMGGGGGAGGRAGRPGNGN